MKRFIVLAAMVLFVASLSQAQTVWSYDPVHSAVRFTVTHMVVSEVSGRFDTVAVKFTQGKDDFSGSTIEANIRTASVNTDNAARDKHLRSEDFFAAERFPEMTFKSTSFEKTGANTFKISGDLTMRGVTKPVVLDAKLNGKVADPFGNTRLGFKATATINRQDWGVKFGAKLASGDLVVSDNVDITLTCEFVTKSK